MASIERFDRQIKFLTSIVLALSGLGLLFIPGRLGALSAGLSLALCFWLGLGLFFISWANQSAIFVRPSMRVEKSVYALSIVFLGILGYLYFRARLWMDVLALLALASGHLYLLFLSGYFRKAHAFFSRLGFGGLNLAVGCLLLGTPAGMLGYENLVSWKLYLGGIYVLFGMTGVAAFVWQDTPVSSVMARMSAIPWLLWSVLFLFPLQINTVLVAFGIGIFPLIADVVPWDEIKLSKDDFLGPKALLAAGLTEILMLASMLASGYAAQRFAWESSDVQASLTVFNQDVAFLSIVVVKGVMLYGLAFMVLTINKLTMELFNAGVGDTMAGGDISLKNWSQWIARSLKPLTSSSQSLQTRVEIQAEQIAALSQQLGYEKQRTAQYNLLLEMSYQLEAQLDPPVAAQIAVNTLQRALNCSQVAIYEHDLDEKDFAVIASAGNFLPPGYRQQTSEGVLGRALRLRKTQIVSNTKLDHDFISLNTYPAQSLCVVPLIHHGHVKAMLEIGDEKANFFHSYDVHLAEKVAGELLRAWERSSYRQRLTNLIRAGISLSPLLEPQTTIKEIATIARDTLQARFIFVTLLDQEGDFSRVAHTGDAPRLLNSLVQRLAEDSTIKAALNACEAFRIRDIRKYSRSSRIEIDHAALRSLLAIPIRLHRLSIGAILAFGKQGEVFFSENDESLAGLLSSEAATAIEATWLYQELRNTLNSTTQLYNLSVTIIQAEELSDAARHIAETAAKVANATASGIVLFSKEQEIETEVEIDERGAHPGENHPMDLIQQTLQSGQTIHVTPDQVAATICFPLQTPLRKYGALWLEVPNIREYFARHASNMQTLANQAALALERSILLVESQQQAKAIEAAFQELELAYDRTLVALMSALDARDRETEGHSVRVSKLACRLGKELRLDEEQLKSLERGSLLHDIGKIGISDTILHKPGNLTEDEWKLMRLHPDIGTRIIAGIPFLADTLPVIRYHQERWDGSGYPEGLSGEDIPELARIFAVVDAFDALTSDRPYRKRISTQEALAYLKEQAGILFDPIILTKFEALILDKKLDDLGI